MMPCLLSIQDFRLQIRLGCGEEERSRPQAVRFDLAIRFERLPAGSESDELGGTICYDALSKRLRELCESRQFKLIEHLGWEAYRALLPEPPLKLWLKVTKLHPPIPGLEGGASFELGEPLGRPTP